MAGEWGELLLPEYVFLEVTTVLMGRRGLPFAVAYGATLLESQEARFVACSEHFVAAFDRFRATSGRGMSFTDAAILVIAETEGAGYVATFDADFQRAPGLTVVP